MRGWTVAMVTAGMLVGMEAGAFQPYFPGESSPEVAELRAKLAAQEAHLARLEEEATLYEEAEGLGIVAAVEASRLPERQQRRLAMAIVREAKRNKVDPMLVVAVIRCESSFNNYAVSHVGAMGLMQVMPDTGNYLADRAGFKLQRHTNLFDSELNVELGTAYLADLIERFGSPERALVAYNAGPGLAKKILSKKEKRDRFMAGYPAKVMKEFRRLKAQQAREVSQREAQKQTSGGPG
ncbi:soluble lytic murein transglycosylase [Archangium gephyra]|uniref:Soluble lytic murein transglycosylase n=1 Tax=Archangium gephyra TaxID=48 RepID=A0AAC8QBH9_9BACT|nr:lytic transglycosylase domain-containing protein [Archangium gephyra]AKJ04310.1 Transglycosylase SLT domain protein [Archangium gephyra]REG37612.1 soluble lytic murein transglycosylase [Archangium gephyra]